MNEDDYKWELGENPCENLSAVKSDVIFLIQTIWAPKSAGYSLYGQNRRILQTIKTTKSKKKTIKKKAIKSPT